MEHTATARKSSASIEAPACRVASWNACAGVAMPVTTRPCGRSATFGPAPQLPRQPHAVTTMPCSSRVRSSKSLSVCKPRRPTRLSLAYKAANASQAPLLPLSPPRGGRRGAEHPKTTSFTVASVSALACPKLFRAGIRKARPLSDAAQAWGHALARCTPSQRARRDGPASPSTPHWRHQMQSLNRVREAPAPSLASCTSCWCTLEFLRPTRGTPGDRVAGAWRRGRRGEPFPTPPQNAEVPSSEGARQLTRALARPAAYNRLGRSRCDLAVGWTRVRAPVHALALAER